jgi:hypothetical protein
MSTVRANQILDAAGGNTARINGMTPTAQSLQGFRNRIINGDMRIDQRNGGASVTPTDGQYTIDRWRFQVSQTSKLTAQRNAGSVTPPAGFTNYLGITSSSAYSIGSSDYFGVFQQIEGFNIADLAWGTANAAPVTLSFWVRSSLTGTFGGNLKNGINNRTYPFAYTISSANTWELKTITIAGDTTGTWYADSGAGIQVNFSLGTGSTFSGTAGAWAAANFASATGATSVVGTNGATFYITGVQLEAGSVATPFEQIDYGRELMLCQRYAVVYNSNDSNQSNRIAFGMASNAVKAFCMVKHPVTMRAKPSLSSAGVFILSDTVTANNVTGSIIQSVTSDVHQTNIEANVASGLTQYRPYFYEFGSAGGTLTLSSEL